jgi:hypothetical protein
VSKTFAAAGLTLVVLLIAGCGGGGGAGPLAWPKDAGSSVSGIPVKPGQFALTAIPLDPRLVKQRWTLLSVRPEYPAEARGLKIRYAAKTIRDALIGGARGWRPTARGLHRLAGYVVEPHTPTEIVIGAAAAKRGVYLLRGFLVDYRVGSTTYHAAQQIGLQVCVQQSCP